MPTWTQLAEVLTSILEFFPPSLSMQSSLLMHATATVASNTPDAASTAADLEVQEDPPKSRPEPEKGDVEKQHVFDIDF